MGKSRRIFFLAIGAYCTDVGCTLTSSNTTFEYICYVLKWTEHGDLRVPPNRSVHLTWRQTLPGVL